MSKLLCPNCKSENLSANKKGFSGKKAFAGALLFGGIGILAGTIGSNKIIITCLNCGNEFGIGEGYEDIKVKNDFSNNNESLQVTLNNKLHNIEFTDFCKEYPNVKISMQKTGGIFHDRFIVLDYGISKYTPVIATLLKNPTLILPQQRGVNVLRKKTKCYIYTRVSTAIQVDGYSLDAQKDKLRKYAEFQDMEIVGEYSDEGHSGKNIKGRQEFMRMLNEFPCL